MRFPGALVPCVRQTEVVCSANERVVVGLCTPVQRVWVNCRAATAKRRLLTYSVMQAGLSAP